MRLLLLLMLEDARQLSIADLGWGRLLGRALKLAEARSLLEQVTVNSRQGVARVHFHKRSTI